MKSEFRRRSERLGPCTGHQFYQDACSAIISIPTKAKEYSCHSVNPEFFLATSAYNVHALIKSRNEVISKERKLFCVMYREGNVCRHALICFKVNINGISLLVFLPEITNLVSWEKTQKLFSHFSLLNLQSSVLHMISQKCHFCTKFYTSASKLSQWYKKKVATHLWAAHLGWGRNFCILNFTSELTGCMTFGKPFDVFSFPILPHCMATDFMKETLHKCDGPKLWNDIYRWHCVQLFRIHNCPT